MVASFIGTLGCRTHVASLGLPARFPCPGTSLACRLSTIWAIRAASNAPPPVLDTYAISLAPRLLSIRLIFFAMSLISSLLASTLRRWHVTRRETDLQIVAIDDQPDCALFHFAVHAIQKRSQLCNFPLNGLPAGVALDDHRIIEQHETRSNAQDFRFSQLPDLHLPRRWYVMNFQERSCAE